MDALRRLRPGLAAVALAAAVLPASSAAGAVGAHRTVAGRHDRRHAGGSRRAGLRETTLTRGVAGPGLYRVVVVISYHARRPRTVHVLIGPVWRSARIGGRHRHGVISLALRIHGDTLTVRARSVRRAPRVAIRLRRLGLPRVRPVAPAASPPTPPTAPVAPAASAPAPAAAESSSAALPASAGPLGDPGSWQLIFDDEFSGTSLNAGNWSTGWFGSGITAPVNTDELECYDPAQVAVDGELDLTLAPKAEICGGQTRPYASGLLTTSGKFAYTYGFLQARVWVPGSGTISDWPAIWEDGTGSWPQTGEIDVLEGLQGQACWHFHYGTPSDPQAQGGCSTSTFTGGWQTVGADWEPGQITYYYDGAVVGTVTSNVTSAPMYLVLDLADDAANSGPLEAPATLRIAYVRVWQH